MSQHKVLIITGTVVTPRDKSLVRTLQKQILQWRSSRHAWLEVKIKATIAETVVIGETEKKKTIRSSKHKKLQHFLQSRLNDEVPELTEVALATLLQREEIAFDLANWEDAFVDDGRFAEKLKTADVIFASTTFLRDLSELIPLIEKIRLPQHKIVVGGALAGTLANHWAGHPSIDLVAIGYGEFLVPQIAKWIRSDFSELNPPAEGRREKREFSEFLFSGTPKTLSLDFIERPDWSIVEKRRNKNYEMISYESVRGCPYRCAFCNYPYLFDDTKFRTKSAQKMADDWEAYYRELGITYITCLDSLFTMPKARLLEFCQEIIRRELPIRWICYARADDLCDEEVVKLLLSAGCIQVQIGIESGDSTILQNMNKRTTEEINRKALLNCRKYGLTTVVTMIVGFPGETKQTLENTLCFLTSAPPDFVFFATFSTRVEGVPILNSTNREKFKLETMNNLYTMSPYWSHATMNCLEASKWARWMSREIIRRKIALDAALFYGSILFYEPELREELLALQERSWRGSRIKSLLFQTLHRVIDYFFAKDFFPFVEKPAAVFQEEALE